MSMYWEDNAGEYESKKYLLNKPFMNVIIESSPRVKLSLRKKGIPSCRTTNNDLELSKCL